MIYIENITTSQQVYIPRQVINTGSTQNGGCIDLEDYYTREEVDELIGQVTGEVTKEYVDDQDAATLQSAKDYTDQEIAAETARTESTYAKSSDIPSLDGYATEEWVEEQDYLKETDLADYAKSSAVTQEITSAIASETARTESTYAKSSAVTEEITSAMASETARTESVYAKKSEIPSLDGYATEQWVEEQDYLKEGDLTDYAKSSAVTQEISSAIASETARTESVYAKKSEIPSLDGYATEQWVEGQGYVTENDLTDYAKTSAVTADIASAITAETARTESVYAKKSEIPSLDGYATEQWVEEQGYVTENDLGDYAKSSAVTQEIASAITAETARTESTYAKSSAVTQEIATAIASETARTESTYLKTGALDNYYTSGQTNAEISAATDSVIDWVGDQNYLQESDLADYAKSSAVTLEIESAIIDETARTEGTYLKPADIAGKLNTSDFNTYTAATETEIDGKVDTSDFNTYTAATATELAGKQETLVSGTNIKTINNQSLLGSGNIDIQGGGGSGSESVIELTQAEYDALTEYAEDTTYIITDATPINMDNYATTADTEAIADDVEALSGTVANKADKANITARTGSGYLPQWNAQGVITGDSNVRFYSNSYNINGSARTMLSNTNNSLTVYAPTSAGADNAILMSNGSGAPSWSSIKMQFISQSAYDALTTKDASTIYFIISED